MEKIIERDLKNGFLELIDEYIKLYSDLAITSMFKGSPFDVTGFLGGVSALEKLRRAVEDDEFKREDTIDIEELNKILESLRK